MTTAGITVFERDVLLPSGLVLLNVHTEDRCAGRVCVIHQPTDHHMRGWPLHWRDDLQHVIDAWVNGARPGQFGPDRD